MRLWRVRSGRTDVSDKTVIAILSTAGIGHGGRRYIARAATEAMATDLVFKQFQKRRRFLLKMGWPNDGHFKSAADLAEYFGVQYFKLADGECIDEED